MKKANNRAAYARFAYRAIVCMAIAALCVPFVAATAPTTTQSPPVTQEGFFGEQLKASILGLAAVCGAILVIVAFPGKLFRPAKERFVGWMRKALRIEDSNKTLEDRFVAIEARITEDVATREKQYAVMSGQNETIAQTLESVLELVQETNRRMGLSDESNKSLVRDAITKTFYRYCKRQAIPIHEKENMSRLYDVYRGYDGNSYVSSIMRKIDEWEVLSGDDAPSCRVKPE